MDMKKYLFSSFTNFLLSTSLFKDTSKDEFLTKEDIKEFGEIVLYFKDFQQRTKVSKIYLHHIVVIEILVLSVLPE